ncbi:hypothetical protein V8G54_020538 [Vigna mungo]|uniref:Uncharacterized protein n=1 Tax=Vigna mungo TaxID=3915 RepID=A0AAQ3NE10_VIGMU
MESTGRVPLSDVVADCAKRWFKDTLKEAKAGDINMQVLVGQMYYHGYGIPKDGQKADVVSLGMKGRLWLTKASRVRSSVWRVGRKPPGYNASDSESDDLENDS